MINQKLHIFVNQNTLKADEKVLFRTDFKLKFLIYCVTKLFCRDRTSVFIRVFKVNLYCSSLTGWSFRTFINQKNEILKHFYLYQILYQQKKMHLTAGISTFVDNFNIVWRQWLFKPSYHANGIRLTMWVLYDNKRTVSFIDIFTNKICFLPCQRISLFA